MLETYLEMPLDVLELIIRHVSRRPLSENWPCFIAAEDAETIFSNDCPLGRVFRNQFKDVSLGVNSITRSKTIALRGDFTNSRSLRAYAKIAQTLEGITFDGKQDGNLPSCQIQWLRVTLPCLRRSNLRGIRSRYLIDFLSITPNLKSLTLDKYSSSRANLLIIAQQCNSGLKRIEFYFHKGTPNLFWQNHGATLEILDLTMLEIVAFSAIQQYCGILKNLSIRSHFQLPGIVRLLESVGSNLQSITADFRNCTNADISRIAQVCPKASFDVLGVIRAGMIARLDYKVPKLTLSKSAPRVTNNENWIFDEYHTLRELTLCLADEKALHFTKLLLRTPKPKLEKIHITVEQNSTEKLLGCISSRVSTLLVFSLVSRTFPALDLCRLLSQNKRIADISLTTRRVTPANARQFVKFANSCTNLKHVLIKESIPTAITAQDVFELSTACRNLRLRGVSIRISGIDYVW